MKHPKDPGEQFERLVEINNKKYGALHNWPIQVRNEMERTAHMIGYPIDERSGYDYGNEPIKNQE